MSIHSVINAQILAQHDSSPWRFAPPKLDYLCVNSTKRRYSENQYREITTANWGLATTNQRELR